MPSQLEIELFRKVSALEKKAERLESMIVRPTGGSSPTYPIAANLGGTGIANAVGSTLTLGGATVISTGGTIALGGFTLTVPATGIAALLATANVFTANNSFTLGTASTNFFISGAGNITTTATKAIGIGINALLSLTDGIRNTAIGYDTLKANTTGYSNTAIGDTALMANVGGKYNVAIGIQSLKTNISGDNNTGVGLDALQYNLASNNTAIGFQAANNNSSGTANVAIGVSALYTNTTGVQNTAIGFQTLYYNDTTSQNTAVGNNALQHNTASNNTAIGYNAGSELTTGTPNIAIGAYALDACTTAANNVAIGYDAAGKTTGRGNVAIGTSALVNNVAGINNTAIGTSAMASGSGSRNVIIGVNAGYYETGSDKLFIDNASRTSEAVARTSSLLYGVFNATVASQTLTINGLQGINTVPTGTLHVVGISDVIQTIVKANATQTANIAEFQKSDATVYALINPVGGATFNETGDAAGDFRAESDTEANMLFLDANGDTDGALYFGGTTNGVKINKGGQLSFIGTAGIKDATNIIFGTTTGTKIGTATTQKLGFWNVTPVVQPAHIADPAGGATVDTEARAAIASINALLATLGLSAAS